MNLRKLVYTRSIFIVAFFCWTFFFFLPPLFEICFVWSNWKHFQPVHRETIIILCRYIVIDVLLLQFPLFILSTNFERLHIGMRVNTTQLYKDQSQNTHSYEKNTKMKERQKIVSLKTFISHTISTEQRQLSRFNAKTKTHRAHSFDVLAFFALSFCSCLFVYHRTVPSQMFTYTFLQNNRIFLYESWTIVFKDYVCFDLQMTFILKLFFYSNRNFNEEPPRKNYLHWRYSFSYPSTHRLMRKKNKFERMCIL